MLHYHPPWQLQHYKSTPWPWEITGGWQDVPVRKILQEVSSITTRLFVTRKRSLLRSNLMSLCRIASQTASFFFLVTWGPNLAKRTPWFWRTIVAKVLFCAFVNIFSNTKQNGKLLTNENIWWISLLIRCSS